MMASGPIKMGIQECSKCEYKLRCSECAARGALEILRHSNTCENCKLEGCTYRPSKGEVRINCVFWTDDPADVPSELDALIKAASAEQAEGQKP